MERNRSTFFKAAALGSLLSVTLTGCGFSVANLPLPGGADVGSNPYEVKVQFRDVLDLVPESAVRVNDVAVGKVRKIELNGWTAVVTLQVNRDAKLPDNAEATLRQSSLLGEKFVSLAAPKTGAVGNLSDGDVIPLAHSGRNPEIEEVLGATSLLFNGGGLEKTRTVVRELNKTLDGNEPEVKALLKSAGNFVTQLDNNKAALISSLEKVNRLAVETNKQKSAITGALDELPAALTVLNQQRGDLVKLFEALHRLGDVGTRVVKGSKADTVADLKALGPIFRNLADAGDNVARSLTTLLTFPFPDGIVGNTPKDAKDFQMGDYANLSVRLDVSEQTIKQILGANDTPAVATTGSPTAPLTTLADLVGGLVPKLPTGLPSLPSADGLPGVDQLPGSSTSPQQGTAPSDSSTTGGLPTFCSLLGRCRVAPANVVTPVGSDLGKLLIEPVVAQ